MQQIEFILKQTYIQNLPDSDNSTFLGLGAGEGDSLFSVPLCFVTKKNTGGKTKQKHL